MSDIVIRRVYEGENFKISFGNNSVEHDYDGKSERGKMVGVYGILTKLDGEKFVDYMTRAEALRIRDAHSRGWQAFKAGRTKDNFWNTDEDAAIEKTAAKKFLRPFAAKSEGLSMLFSNEDDEPAEWTPPARDVADRMAARLDAKVERVATQDMKQAEPADAEVVEEKPAGESGTVELF